MAALGATTLVAVLALTLLALSSDTHAALSRTPLQQKPDRFANEKGCYLKEVDKVIAFGASAIVPGQCKKIKCAKKELLYMTCGVGNVPPGCDAEYDNKQDYPACCNPTLSCSD